jgi:NADPH:quinone reductase-like Zn-dependent oxidoreductase
MAGGVRPPLFTVGWDVAGTVDAVGGRHPLAVGDTVLACRGPARRGRHAEFVTAPSRHFAHRPAGLGGRGGRAAARRADGLQCLVDIADIRPASGC